MNLVIDASVAVTVVLDMPAAEGLTELIRDADQVAAPDLFASEVGNVFWKYHRFKDLDQASCERGIRQCLQLPDEYIPGVALVQDAFLLAGKSGLTVYDGMYLECARRSKAALLTLDRKLAAVGKKNNIDVLRPA